MGDRPRDVLRIERADRALPKPIPTTPPVRATPFDLVVGEIAVDPAGRLHAAVAARPPGASPSPARRQPWRGWHGRCRRPCRSPPSAAPPCGRAASARPSRRRASEPAISLSKKPVRPAILNPAAYSTSRLSMLPSRSCKPSIDKHAADHHGAAFCGRRAGDRRRWTSRSRAAARRTHQQNSAVSRHARAGAAAASTMCRGGCRSMMARFVMVSVSPQDWSRSSAPSAIW